MSTYFHGNPSEIAGNGADGLQTLILMNPGYVGYSDSNQSPHPSQSSSNFVFLNPAANHNQHHNNNHLPHAPPYQTQHFVGIPLQSTTTTSQSSASPHDQQDVSAIHGFLPPPRIHYNLYDLPVDLGAAREVTRVQQGLSLSLSSQQPPPGYGSFIAERPEVVVPSQATAVSPPRGDDVRAPPGSPSPASAVSNGVNGVHSMLLSSKYLKAAQELLDEVVNVGRGVKSGTEQFHLQTKNIGDNSVAAGANGEGQSGGESSAIRVGEITTAERQEVQMKKSKLVNMLDEVEQRYRQYHHQMQIVISWFEQAAGLGSAKTYTALALQTISKQFRSLKDAILRQIKAASKSLGEEENLEGKIEGSRLKYVDNQIRQQRALQQLGMIQHNAWRPQRGLPERSVSVLRAWLFEHFLHPYPKDSDKLMLAKQTGLTRSQVSNWFINARVRLWKPMVEEMYMEEMKEHERNASEDYKIEHNEDSNSKSKSPNNTEHHNNNNTNTITPKHDTTNPVNPNPTSPPGRTTMRHIPGFNIIGSSSPSSQIEIINQNSPKKLRISDMLSNTTNDGHARDGYTLMGAPTNFIGGFGSYPMGELGRFGPTQFHQAQYMGNNGVSLTLGLPHCENLGSHQTFMPNHQSMQIADTSDDFSRMNAQTNANNVYESISIQDRKRFAAQLLPDFVA